MDKITLEKFYEQIKDYNEYDQKKIIKAYQMAEELHKGQFRESGDPYIIHPLSVAYILSELRADADTVCAGLLHDTLEDTKLTKEEIVSNFNQDVANLVDGVTKIAKMNFSSKKEQNLANTRKILTSLRNDVRIVIIKLADRLHNMRTLEYKKEIKQKENALETLDIFVPLAYYIGAYRIRNELEDLSLKYLEPYFYQTTLENRDRLEKEEMPSLQHMLEEITESLKKKNIISNIKIRTKNIYGIYKKLSEGKDLSEIHDLFSLKIMVPTVDDCYVTLGQVHGLYHVVNNQFKDYICTPKPNMYQSLHTTVFGKDDRLVQAQIRTFDMDIIASFGLPAYWQLKKGLTRNDMQQMLREKFQFYKSLEEIDTSFSNNKEFIEQIRRQLLTTRISVYTMKGNTIQLPKGSTPVDFAYELGPEVGNSMQLAVVNDKKVPFNHTLQNEDRVRIVTDPTQTIPNPKLLKAARTIYAQQMIKKFTPNS